MPTEIVSSRKKIVLMLLGSLCFVAIAFILPGPPNLAVFWSGLLFSASSAIFLAMLLRPQRLRLDEQGITVSGGLLKSPTKVAWLDVSNFFLVYIRPGVSMVAFNYAPNSLNKPKGAAFSRRIAGADGAIRGIWPGSKAALVDRLNECRERAIRDEDV